MVYNLTGIGTNTTNLVTFVQSVNDNLMQGWLGILFILGVSVIAFIAFMTTTNDIKRSMTAATTMAFLMSIFFTAVELVPPLMLYITMVMAAITIALSYRSNR